MQAAIELCRKESEAQLKSVPFLLHFVFHHVSVSSLLARSLRKNSKFELRARSLFDIIQ
jgi:hypothetical protein